jgi:tRNA nucleotidyltransferase/poly(A) polymerase
MKPFFKFYEVGGKVRDEILGVQSKDVDFVAVPKDSLIEEFPEAADLFEVLVDYLTREKFQIFLVTAECYTIRAKFPEGHKYQGVADFVMARKEIGYVPFTRTPIVKPGTLFDDLERRDFTLNAIAKDENGALIDPFNGIEDLQNGVIRTPLPCEVTFKDDPLRILRAIRFMITKGFVITAEMHQHIKHFDYEVFMAVVSAERIREELLKCFKHDTAETLKVLMRYPALFEYIFMTKIWLKPTMEE